MAELPHGTVTFLFTDIEGSTALWERDRMAMAAAVERHLAILQSIIAAHDGVLYKTIGDGTQAAFGTAKAGLLAAFDAQRAFLAEHWGDRPGPLRVRMAMHAGEAEPHEGDYLATPLNRLTRLLAIGHGGQILLSQTVQQLSRGGLPEGTSLRDLGEHRLRDLLEPERVFQLVHPQLPDQFPPLVSLEARPNNLPRQPTAFLGREREVGAVVALLRRPDVQLLTLTGPGGSGKTRLALQAAAELLDDFPDGVFFVSLASIADPRLVPATIATTLGLREDGATSVRDRLSAFLTNKHMLLVVDNFEHLVEAAPVIGDLLRAAPHLTVLATSRAPLHLQAEHEYPVPALALPPRQPLPPPEQLGRYEAVQLFVARAQAVQPTFALDDENGPAIVEICWRVDGLPLAIELAAVRIRLLSPQALLARLEQRLPVLTGGARDAPARQQTLSQTITWSYDLLAAPEQTLFRRLAVFAGSFGFAAAEAVANPAGDTDIFSGVTLLVEQSLLRPAESVEGEPRFAMLQTIREYARVQLSLRGDQDAVERLHAAYFLAFAERAREMINGREQALWLVRLDAEQDNLRAVFERAMAAGDAETALRLASALWRFWGQRGHLGEGRAAFERALALEGDVEASIRGTALLLLGDLTLDLNEYAAGQRYFGESLPIWRTLGDQDGIASALNGLGMIDRELGEYERACERFEEALTIWSSIDDVLGVAAAHYNLGIVATAQGDYDRARSYLTVALSLRRQRENVRGSAYSLWALATVARLTGNMATALDQYHQSQALFADLGDRQGEALALHGLAKVSQQAGSDVEALHLFRDVLTNRQSLGERDWIVESLEGIAEVMIRRGHIEPGVRLLAVSTSLRGKMAPIPTLAERQEQEQTLAIARRSLTNAAFAEAWAGGQALSVEQATAEALAMSEESAVITRPAAPFNLTRREQEVLALLCQHRTDPEIASQLFITTKTASNHVSNILSKLGVANRREAVAFATRHSLV